jgi:hypothetical protein
MWRTRALAVAALALALALAPAGGASAAPKTVWLCKPGLAKDPCTPGLRTTFYSPSGERLRVGRPHADRPPKFDCFYVYPTVSDQKTPLANRHVDPEQRSIALYQTARYSQHCRVFAPMYRQYTLAALLAGGLSPELAAIPYGDVRNAWRTYLRKYNHGRGVVLVSHSQGTYMLRQLVAREIDPKPRLRRKLISAVLLGGNVTVAQGRDAGGDFKHVRACRSRRQTGCVVAYSTFNAPVPEGARFGRTDAAGQEVLCTNPANLRGGAGILDPISPSAPFAPGTTIAAAISITGVDLPHPPTPWVEIPGAYRASCSSAGGADVLQITPQRGAPVYTPSPDPGWGLHLVDANIALGNLVDLVRAQAATWARRHSR